MNKQKVGYLYNGIWFNHKKEWSSITCCNRNEPENITLGKISQSQEDHISYDSIKIKVLVTQFSSVQFSCSVVSDSATPWTVAHQAFLSITNSQSLLKLMSIESDAIQPSHPLSSPSPPAFNFSQHQGLFPWVSSSHQVAKVLEFRLQHQSFQGTFRTDFI